MSKRIILKTGDIFSVKIDDQTKQYFQFICKDATQLSSDVIRIFRKKYQIFEKPGLHEIIQDEVYFYAHCIISLGLKLNFWEKEGNTSDIGKIDNIIFRGSWDSGSKPGEEIKISFDWYIWKINADFKNVGTLKGENRNAELGLVVTPEDIITRIKTGKYDFFYPGYE